MIIIDDYYWWLLLMIDVWFAPSNLWPTSIAMGRFFVRAARHSDPAVSGTIKVGRSLRVDDITQKWCVKKTRGAFWNLENWTYWICWACWAFQNSTSLEPSKPFFCDPISDIFRVYRFMIGLNCSLRMGCHCHRRWCGWRCCGFCYLWGMHRIKMGGGDWGQHGSTKQQLMNIWPTYIG